MVYLLKSENIVAVKLASSLYKLSLQTRETQDLLKDWKDGIIVPVFKKGRRKDCENYRGISLLSIAEKILTRILLNRLNEHIVPISCLRLDVVFAVHGRGTVDMIDPLTGRKNGFTRVAKLQQMCSKYHICTILRKSKDRYYTRFAIRSNDGKCHICTTFTSWCKDNGQPWI